MYLPLVNHCFQFAHELLYYQAAVEVFNEIAYDLLQQRTIAGTTLPAAFLREIIIEIDVFAVVQSSSAEFGLVPFENSSNGPVDFTLDCLIDRQSHFPGVVIVGETYLNVRHCLIGRAASSMKQDLNERPCSSSSPGRLTPTADTQFPRAPCTQSSVDLQHITAIYSHPQAFGQCRNFLSTHLKSAEQHEVSSTSEAASRVAKESSNKSAAIAGKLAAQVYGLDLFATNIQDQDDNTTRFLILRKGDVCSSNTNQGPKAKWKALLAFSIDHKSAGALADALHVFKTYRLNLTSINSRPSRERPWHYIFLVEFECTGESDAIQSQIEQALQALNSKTEGYKCLGYWKENDQCGRPDRRSSCQANCQHSQVMVTTAKSGHAITTCKQTRHCYDLLCVSTV